MVLINERAPDYSGKAVMKGRIEEVTPSTFKNKYVVLVFYKCDFQTHLSAEIIAFSRRAFEFRQIDSEVIGISCDTELAHLRWTKASPQEGGSGSVDIPLVSDAAGHVARAYGVYDEETGLPYRALFVIDRQGVVRLISINDGNVARDVDDILRIVQAFQMSDVYGEVWPSKWKPGSKTISLIDNAFTHYKLRKKSSEKKLETFYRC